MKKKPHMSDTFWQRKIRRDFEVIVCCLVGDMPGSVEDGTKDFILKTLDALDVGWLG